MQKFNFNLESVLNYRLIKEDEAKQKLASANMLAAQQMERLAAYQRELAAEQGRSSFNGSPGGEEQAVVVLTDALHRDIYLDNLQQCIKKQSNEVTLAKAEVLRCQRQVTKAHRETIVLDNLKAKQFEKYLAEMGKQEQNLLDEIGSSGFIRKTME